MEELNPELPPLPEAEYILDGTASTDAYTAEQMRSYALQAVKAERERCAKACEAVADQYNDGVCHPLTRGMFTGAMECADAIRSRNDVRPVLIEAQRKLPGLPYKPEHVTEEQIREAIASLPPRKDGE